MKKKVLALLILVMILSALAMSVHAESKQPTAAAGLWQYSPTILSSREVGGNTFLETVEDGIWTGTFQGDSTEDGKVVIHRSGRWSFNAIVSFGGEVEGESGTLKMSVVGSRPDAFSDWFGYWVILSGTDELATLHGQGTWWGPGAQGPGAWGDIYYAGKIHFAP